MTAPLATPPAGAPRRHLLLAAALVLGAGLAACDDKGPTGDDGRPLKIVFSSGSTDTSSDKQLVLPPGGSEQLDVSPAGDVRWSSRDASIAEVSASGLVQARALGATFVVAAAGEFADSVRVVVSTCDRSASVVTLRPGQVRTFGPGDGADLCLDGAGAQAEYVVVPFVGGTNGSASVPFDVTASSTGFSAEQAAAFDAATATAIDAADRSGEALGFVGTRQRDTRVDERLRVFERTSLEPRMGALREAQRARAGASAPSLAIVSATPALDDVVTVNVDPDDEGDGCTATDLRGARIVAISDRAIILADTLNPANGFSAAEYKNFAVAFDTLAWPVDVQNFGDPSDIDRNGKVLVLFTGAVNEMTPAGAPYYVGGFFHPRDLYPKADTRTLPGCKASNEAEMFYMMVPDPTGTINGNRFDRTFVSRLTIGTLAHEFQHLINAGRRTFVNNATRSETVWLNEGLSHIAEELLFFRASGFGQRMRLDVDQIRTSQRAIDAFNQYANPNMSRLLSWLRTPEGTSPIASNDELGTRGATWQFLRYVADRRNVAERDLWFALVNSTTSGLQNLRDALGGDVDPLLDDWAVANFADGGTTVTPDARWTFRSWDYREIIQTVRSLETYPLKTRTLGEGQKASVAVNTGSAAYFRVPVNAPNVAYVRTRNGTAAMPGVIRMNVVRVK